MDQVYVKFKAGDLVVADDILFGESKVASATPAGWTAIWEAFDFDHIGTITRVSDDFEHIWIFWSGRNKRYHGVFKYNNDSQLFRKISK